MNERLGQRRFMRGNLRAQLSQRAFESAAAKTGNGGQHTHHDDNDTASPEKRLIQPVRAGRRLRERRRDKDRPTGKHDLPRSHRP